MKTKFLILLISIGLNVSASDQIPVIPLEGNSTHSDFSYLLDKPTQRSSSFPVASCITACFNQLRICTRNYSGVWPDHCFDEHSYCIAECTQ